MDTPLTVVVFQIGSTPARVFATMKDAKRYLQRVYPSAEYVKTRGNNDFYRGIVLGQPQSFILSLEIVETYSGE